MVKAFNPKKSERKKTKIINHLSECHHCAEEFEIIRQIFKTSQEKAQEIGKLLSSEEDIGVVRERARQVVSEMKKRKKC